MRAALSEHLAQNIGGYDIILVARGQTPRLKDTQLSKTLGKLFAKAGLPDKAAPAPWARDGPAMIARLLIALLRGYKKVYQSAPRASLPVHTHLQ